MGDLAGPELPRSSAAVAEPTVHDPDAKGHFGAYGGRFVPEALMAVIEEVTAAYEKARGDQAFLDELDRLQRHYSGRPSPLYEASRLSEHAGGARIFLKREDLNHTGSHKINNVLGQALLARQMGKTRVIAETGAGQHGVATATACALLGLECVVYMGAVDTARQALNVARMRLLGAEVVSVEAGSKTLKDAINEAFRDWVTNADNTYYCFGTAAGPHPFPTMVRDFQRVIGLETRVQIVDQAGRLPDAVTACVGGGSNAIGIFHAFIDDPGVRLVGYEAAGDGVETGRHAATFTGGSPGAFQGSFSYLLQDEDGQTIESHSISAGLDYPGVGPEHAFLKDTGRAEYRPITDAEAMDAFALLCSTEGIIPAIESAHAVAGVLKLGPELGSGAIIVINMSGRGDKDVETAAKWFGLLDAKGASMSRLSNLFEACRSEGRSALIGYLPTGFPDVPTSISAMTALIESGCDLVEVGVPYSDPGMDGPTIAAATEAALHGGVRVRDTLAAVEAISNAGGRAVVMTYWNPVLRWGVNAFARDLAAAGGLGLITPDLIPDEAEEWLAVSDAHDLDRIFLVAPSSTPERLAATIRAARGFVYAASTMGVTGARDAVSVAAPELVRRVKAVSDIPVGVGLGVRSREQAAQIGAYADGVIVGSALVSALTDSLPALRALTEELADGVRKRISA